MTAQDEYYRRLLQDTFGGAGETRLREVRANSLIVGTNDNTHQFSEDGMQLFRGRARFGKEIIVHAGDVRSPATGPAQAWRAVGASGGVKVDTQSYAGNQLNEIFVEFHIPEDMDLSAPCSFHVMWTPESGYAAGNFMLGIEYLSQSEDGLVLGRTPKTITKTVTPTPAYWREDEFGPIYIPADLHEPRLMIRFYRDGATDTATHTADVDFYELEYTANRLGSKEDL